MTEESPRRKETRSSRRFGRTDREGARDGCQVSLGAGIGRRRRRLSASKEEHACFRIPLRRQAQPNEPRRATIDYAHPLCHHLRNQTLARTALGSGRPHEPPRVEPERPAAPSVPAPLRDHVPRWQGGGLPGRPPGVYAGSWSFGWKGTRERWRGVAVLFSRMCDGEGEITSWCCDSSLRILLFPRAIGESAW